MDEAHEAPGSALIGCNNVTDPEEDAEAHVFQQVVTHPRYYEPVKDWFTDLHDCALVKIFDVSKVGSVIQLNKDPATPDSSKTCRVLGWGRQNHSDITSASDVLMEADVDYIPNNECKQISMTEYGPSMSMENRVFDTSLCAADFQNGSDTCFGDSGGPILLAGQNADEDLQLGITSWGPVECGHPQYPAVYARVSYFYEWIRENVCRLSQNPGLDFDCEASSASTEPDLSEDMVSLTLEFLVDAMANETGWIVQSPNENGMLVTYAYEPTRTFPKREAGMRLNRTLSLPNNRHYILTMLDYSGNGFSGDDFVLKLSTDSTTILDETLPFKNYTLSFDFILGTLPTPSPTTTPAPTVSISPSMTPTMTPAMVWIEIVFDIRPEETGWRVEALSDNGGVGTTLREVYPGTYNGLTNTSEALYLLPETPMAYRFTITDNEANGICCGYGRGSFRVWLGEPEIGQLLADGHDFVWEASYDFVINGTAVQAESVDTVETSSAVRHHYSIFMLLWTASATLLFANQR